MPAAEAAAGPSAAASWSEARFQSLQGLPVPVRELVAGGASGGFAKTCVAPLERCKILFQTGKVQPGSVTRALQDIFRAEGVQGLFRGNAASVLRIVPYSALYMSSYERYRRGLVELRFMASHGRHLGRVSPVVDLVAGSAAGATAVVATYPLDLVRTRLAFMTEARPAAAVRGAPGSAAAAAAAAAAAGPSSTPSAGGGSSSSSAGGGYHHRFSRSTVPVFAASQSAAAAPRGLTLSMTHAAVAPTARAGVPAAAARHAASGGARRQLHGLRAAAAAAVGGQHQRHTIAGVLRATLRQEGLRGMYHGIGPSLYGILPYAGLKFYMYQALKGRFHTLSPERMRGSNNNRLPVPVMLTYGAAAGLVAQTATYPLDVVRRRMQVEGMVLAQQAAQRGGGASAPALRSCFAFRSTPQALLCIARREGWRALFAGLSINYMKVVPSTAIGFTVYDFMKAHLDLPSNL